MNMHRTRVLFLGVTLLTGLAVWAAAPPANPPASPPASSPPAAPPAAPTNAPATPAAPAAPAATPAATPASPPTAPAANRSNSAPSGPSPQRFVPTEQVRADFDVSFPIDI